VTLSYISTFPIGKFGKSILLRQSQKKGEQKGCRGKKY